MADQIAIDGIEAYDGEYEFDAGYFTNRELHTMKRLSGIRAGELAEALAAGDNDVIVAMTVIALQRHGKYVDEDLIWNAQAGKISYRPELVPTGTDALPPAPPSGTDETSGAAETNGSSGSNGRNGSATSPTTPPVTGPGSSVPSAISGQPI